MSTLDTTSATTHRRSALLAPVGVLAVVAALVAYFGRRDDPTPAP